jgi:hypothetical protein
MKVPKFAMSCLIEVFFLSRKPKLLEFQDEMRWRRSYLGSGDAGQWATAIRKFFFLGMLKYQVWIVSANFKKEGAFYINLFRTEGFLKSMATRELKSFALPNDAQFSCGVVVGGKRTLYSKKTNQDWRGLLQFFIGSC